MTTEELKVTLDERIQAIRTNPSAHRHTFEELQQCIFFNGALDGSLLEAHETYAPVGMNGGHRCDVYSGPCSCGAWH